MASTSNSASKREFKGKCGLIAGSAHPGAFWARREELYILVVSVGLASFGFRFAPARHRPINDSEGRLRIESICNYCGIRIVGSVTGALARKINNDISRSAGPQVSRRPPVLHHPNSV